MSDLSPDALPAGPPRYTRRTLGRRVAVVAGLLGLTPASGATEIPRVPGSGAPARSTPAQGAQATAAAVPFDATPDRVVDIHATLDHPQGIEASADGATWWISAVHRPRRVGLLAACDAATGQVRRLVEVQRGDRYHPGGLSRAGAHLWMPVAEYRRQSSSTIQCRDGVTLDLVQSFDVGDHIGCLATDGPRLVGANWDARTFYAWTPEGREVDRRPNPTEARYQDLKWSGSRLLAGGLLGDEGVIDLLSWPSLVLERRWRTGRTDRGVVLTHEALAATSTALLLMPEDDPVRVFVYPRPAGL